MSATWNDGQRRSGAEPGLDLGDEPGSDHSRLREIQAEYRLFRRVVGARIRSDWQYRTSFFSLLAAQTVIVAFELASLVILLGHVDGLGRWEPNEVVFLYGLSTLAFGLADVLVSQVETMPDGYIRNGRFDSVLLRPASALIQIMALEFELRRAGRVVAPLAALVWAMVAVEVSWTPWRLLGLIVALGSAVVIYAGLWVLAGSITFFAVSTKEATNAMTYGSHFSSQYPAHILPGWLRGVMGWALPLVFVAYIPTIALVDASNPLAIPRWAFLATPLVALSVALVGLAAWRLGIRHYQSTGS